MKGLLILYFVLFSTAIYCQNSPYRGNTLQYTYITYSDANQKHLYSIDAYFFYAINTLFDPLPQFYIFDAATGQLIMTVESRNTLVFNNYQLDPHPCLAGNYLTEKDQYVGYTFDYTRTDWIPLDTSTSGYIIMNKICCQPTNLSNIEFGTGKGVVAYTFIPPIDSNNYYKNGAPEFQRYKNQTVCANNYFEIDYFTAADSDNDSLSYSFVPVHQIDLSKPPAPPPYDIATYLLPYSSRRPMGNKVSINPKTGMISGIAPTTVGDYLVAVQVNEYRNGVLINTNRKEMVVEVEDCRKARFITLPAEYLFCDTIESMFAHTNNSPLINSLHWQFGDGDTSTVYNPTHTYKDTGTYTLKLLANKGQVCSDSAYASVKIYPRPQAGFGVQNNCFAEPVQFSDSSLTLAGSISTYHWLFGDSSATNDTSTIQHPNWLYDKAGDKTITLIVNNDKGCADTLQKTISLVGKPLLQMPFTDTTICLNSSLLLQPNSTAQNFSWQPATSLSHLHSLHTTATPTATTTYTLAVGSGDCMAVDSLRIAIEAPPTANAGSTLTICAGQSVALQGSARAHVYYWQPHSSLSDAQSLQPTATPTQTTQYILQAYDTAICLNPASDTVTIAVLPPVMANAGADTTIIRGQSLQLHAKGGDSYQWLPPDFINHPNSPNPILTIPDDIDSIRYYLIANNQAGCADTASILIRLKMKEPPVVDPPIVDTPIVYPPMEEPITELPVGIFIPSAFTPNGDGLNDYFYPIGSGVPQIKSFKIYNRWGQQLYAAQGLQKGWDGRIKGRPQPSDVYIWMIDATDAAGKPLQQNGSLTLVR